MSDKRELSEAQRRVLRMAVCDGKFPLAAVQSGAVRSNTMWSLVRMGLLEHFEPGRCPWPACRVPLTAAGRLALSEPERDWAAEEMANYDPDDEDPGADCGRWSNGRLTSSCSLAGTEFCDFECPYRDGAPS